MAEDTLAASSSSVNLLCDAEAASGHSSIYAGAGALRLRIYVHDEDDNHDNVADNDGRHVLDEHSNVQ